MFRYISKICEKKFYISCETLWLLLDFDFNFREGTESVVLQKPWRLTTLQKAA